MFPVNNVLGPGTLSTTMSEDGHEREEREVTSAATTTTEEAKTATEEVTTTTASTETTSTEATPPTATSTPDNDDKASTPAPSAWQAVFSPQYNSYYFYNTETQQVTWDNPLLPSASPEPEPETYTSPQGALEAAAVAAGIDPSLAYLDPSLLSSSSSAGPSSSTLPPAFTAKFNARTGQFARPDARDPTHLSEHARAARMSEFYFDVGAWEQQLAEQGGSIMGSEEGKKRKRPSKKDLDRFREQKKQKKLAKTAWLRT